MEGSCNRLLVILHIDPHFFGGNVYHFPLRHEVHSIYELLLVSKTISDDKLLAEEILQVLNLFPCFIESALTSVRRED